MNELQSFTNGSIDLPVQVLSNGDIEFNAEQVAIGLGISETATSGNEVAKWSRINKYLGIDTSVDVKIKRGDYITESQFYRLAFKANNETAEKFQAWVSEEVLPTIRKHGAYMTPEKIEEALLNPDTIINLAQQLKSEREGRLIAEQQVNELQPKATYYDRVLADKSLVTISIIAKDYGMSGRALNKKLHDLGVIYKQGNTWLLYAKYQLTGWTHSDTTIVKRKDGTEKAVLNTKWTQKGRLGLYELLKQENILPLIEQEQAS